MKVFFTFDAFDPEVNSVASKPDTECYRSQCRPSRNGAGRQRSKDKSASGKRKQHLMFEIGETIARDEVACSPHGRGIKAKSHPVPVF